MALADPLPRAAFADLLRLDQINLKPMWQQQGSSLGAGGKLYSDRASMLWTCSPQTVPMEHAEAEGIVALLSSRAGGIKTLLLFNNRLPFPSTDPDGALFGSATPEIGAITDRLHVSFIGFPADYELPRGTYFGVEFDGGRLYLGQFVEARTASGAGAVATAEIWPPLPASIAVGDPVTVAKPPAKFRVQPGTAFISEVSAIDGRVTFQADQTYDQDPA